MGRQRVDAISHDIVQLRRWPAPLRRHAVLLTNGDARLEFVRSGNDTGSRAMLGSFACEARKHAACAGGFGRSACPFADVRPLDRRHRISARLAGK